MPSSNRPDSNPVIEFFVRVYVYLLAAVYAVKELKFEADNQGINRKFHEEIQKSSIVDRNRKAALVTGADGTIGIEIVKYLLGIGFIVHAIVKDRKASPVLRELVNEYGKDRLNVYEVDLESPFKVADFTADHVNRGEILLVILSAGIMLAPERYVEEIESHMCVNVVSQAMIIDAFKDNFTFETRIVALSSTCARAAYRHGSYDRDSLFLRYIGPYQAYAMSKLTLCAYVSQLAKQECLKVASVHPGVVPGRLYRNVNFFLKLFTYFVLPNFMRSAKFAALSVIRTALRDDFVPGAYYEDSEVKDVPSRLSEKDQRTIYDSVKKYLFEIAHNERSE